MESLILLIVGIAILGYATFAPTKEELRIKRRNELKKALKT